MVDGVPHRVAVNVTSDRSPSELLFLLEADYHHAVVAALSDLDDGFTALPSRAGGLVDIFDLHVHQAIDVGASLRLRQQMGTRTGQGRRVFPVQTGQRHPRHPYEPGKSGPPRQGKRCLAGRGIFIHFPDERRWLAFFLAFQSQFGRTDDDGNPLPGSPPFGRSALAR